MKTIILGIETSCDETGVAIFDGQDYSLMHSQIDFHAEFGGIVPELASRLHCENINILIERVLKISGYRYKDLSAIAVTIGPGLIGSLIVGISAALAIRDSLRIPIIPVDHIRAHMSAYLIEKKKAYFPSLGLAVSGGHTLLFRFTDFYNYDIMGTTVDDAIGEAYDKVAKYCGIGYPGGPIIDKLFSIDAVNKKIFSIPMLHSGDYNFSYSGLKTALINYIRKKGIDKLDNKEFLVELLSSFQYSAVQQVYKKAVSLAKKSGIRNIIISGGVAANSYLREIFQNSDYFENIIIPSIRYCTDNGSMIAALGYKLFNDKKYEKTSYRSDYKIKAYNRLF